MPISPMRNHNQRSRKAVGALVAEGHWASVQAVRTLVDVMEDEDSPASSRVAAARAVLELTYRGLELEDLASRVDYLEGFLVREAR